MEPMMLKVLFLVAAAIEAWADSAHSQQLDWQIYVYWVSGTADNEATYDTSALWSNPWLTPFPSPGSSLNSQGHSGSDGVETPPPPPYSARLLALTWPSLCFKLLLGAAIAPTRRTINTIADCFFILLWIMDVIYCKGSNQRFYTDAVTNLRYHKA